MDDLWIVPLMGAAAVSCTADSRSQWDWNYSQLTRYVASREMFPIAVFIFPRIFMQYHCARYNQLANHPFVLPTA